MAEMTLQEQAKSILSVISASIKNKTVLAKMDLIEQRVEVCRGCDKLTAKMVRGKPWLKCSVCGCGYRKKVAFHNSKCPLGKW